MIRFESLNLKLEFWTVMQLNNDMLVLRRLLKIQSIHFKAIFNINFVVECTYDNEISILII